MSHSQPKQFSFLTFNTLGTPILSPNLRARYHKIAKMLNDSHVDIVCLQEVQTYYHVHVLKKFMRSYPYVLFNKNFVGPKGGLAIFSKIPLETHQFFTYTNLGDLHNFTIYSRFMK